MQCINAVKKKHYFPHTVHYCCSSMPRLSVTCWCLQCSEKRGVLWLASYPVRCDWPIISSVWWKCYALLLCCDAVSWHDDTKTIKPIKRRIFCIQWGHNYWLKWLILSFNASRCIAPRKHYHVCICDRRNEKQQALLSTAQNSSLNSQWQIL